MLSPLMLSAQTNAPGTVYPPNRFLVVIETSHSMQGRIDALNQTLQNLLRTSIAAQARRGDSLGLWTFNDEVSKGVFPLQQWSPDTQKPMTDRVTGFVKAQKFEKKARFDKLIPALNGLAKNSQFLTAVIVCSGDTDIQGTPFDDRINEFFRAWRVQSQGAGSPFVISLRAQAGTFVDFSTNPWPWPAELPPLPKDLLIPRPVRQAPVAETRKPVTSSVPPLIISGKKQPVPPATNLQATNTNAPAQPGIAAQSSPRNRETAVAEQQPATTQTDPALPSKESAAALLKDKLSPSATELNPRDNRLASSASPPSEKNSDKAFTPISQSGTNPEQGSALSPPADSRTNSAMPARVSAANPVAKPAIATAVPVSKPVYRGILIFTGAISIGAILAVVWLLRARARRTADTSLITESIDRRKP